MNTIGLQLAFNSTSFKKVYHISQPHPGPDRAVGTPRSCVGAAAARTGAVSGRMQGGRSPPYRAAVTVPQLRRRRRACRSAPQLCRGCRPVPQAAASGPRRQISNDGLAVGAGAVAGAGSVGGEKGSMDKRAVKV